MKVIDLARELNKPPRDIIKVLSDIGIRAKSPSTKINKATVSQVKKRMATLADSKNQQENDPEEKEIKIINLKKDSIAIKDLAELTGTSLTEIMTSVLKMGLLLNLNSEIDGEVAKKICTEIGIELLVDTEDKSETSKIKDISKQIEDDEIGDKKELSERPPVVTIMGHVDHGKTLLLDTIRQSNVISNEAGGITQHIGAYKVIHNSKPLTILDTPGQAAFTALRARGEQLTDITILVIAADEGIKPQTKEAIHHAKAANVPIIVALNKSDKENADIEKCKQDLVTEELVPEDWGGSTIVVPVSAKTGDGINDLLEMILLVSEMLELKAITSGEAKGVVIESRLSRKKGPVATVLIKTGKLKIGDNFVIGTFQGKTRALLNDLGERITEAGPGDPVEILGISNVPRPGDILEVKETEKEIKTLIAKRSLGEKTVRENILSRVSLENISQQIGSGEIKSLNLIIKADVNGTVEAINSAIQQIDSKSITVNIIHSATGPLSESDVMLGVASNAIIICFNAAINPDAQTLANKNHIEIKTYSVIYEIMDDISKAIDGLFTPEMVEIEIGKAEVRQLYHFSKIGVIAGSQVLNGKVIRNSIARIFRDSQEVYSGKINSLKRFKEDAKEVLEGFECGIVLENCKDIVEGDIVHCYELKEKE